MQTIQIKTSEQEEYKALPESIKKFRFLKVYLFTAYILTRYLIYFSYSRIFSQEYREKIRKKIDKKNGERVYAFIMKQKGIFIKIGQFAGLLRTVLTEEFVLPLLSCQDKVTPQPFSVMEVQLINSLGKDYAKHFVDFDKNAIAAASIGQVHKAKIMQDGKVREVACKILYPFIEELVEIDLKSIHAIFGLIKIFIKNFKGNAVYPQIEQIIKGEINLKNEANNLLRIQQNFRHETEYKFPKIHLKLSSYDIMVTEYINGTKITDVEGLKKINVQPKEAAALLVKAYAKMIFQDLFFHGDPHPGNLLVLPGPKIAFLDFGACPQMKEFSRNALRKIIRSAMAKDYFKVIEGLKELGAVPKTADLKVLETAVSYAIDKMAKIEREVTDISTLSFEELSGIEDLRYLNQFNIGLNDLLSAFDIPEGWISLERVIGHVLAIIIEISPESTIGSLAKPFLTKLILDDYKELKDLVSEQGKIAAFNFFDLPQNLNNVLNQLQRGRIEIGIQNFENSAWELMNVQKQIVWAIFSAIFAFGSFFCYTKGLDYLFVNFSLMFTYSIFGSLRAIYKTKSRIKYWQQSEGHQLSGFKLKSQ